jgi:hypothetical protein
MSFFIDKVLPKEAEFENPTGSGQWNQRVTCAAPNILACNRVGAAGMWKVTTSPKVSGPKDSFVSF